MGAISGVIKYRVNQWLVTETYCFDAYTVRKGSISTDSLGIGRYVEDNIKCFTRLFS